MRRSGNEDELFVPQPVELDGEMDPDALSCLRGEHRSGVGGDLVNLQVDIAGADQRTERVERALPRKERETPSRPRSACVNAFPRCPWW